MGELKNTKHELFAHHYAKEPNGSKAYSKVYPDATPESAATSGTNLLQNVDVKARIAELVDEIAKKLDVKNYDVARAFMHMGNYNLRDLYDENGDWLPIHKLPEALSFAIVGIKKTVTGSGKNSRTSYEYKFADKVRANENLGKHLGFYKEHNEQKGGIDVGHLEPEQQEAVLAALLGAQ